MPSIPNLSEIYYIHHDGIQAKLAALAYKQFDESSATGAKEIEIANVRFDQLLLDVLKN